MNIKKGAYPAPAKVVIYGQEGIGKSTLAGKFPKPLFIDLDGGTARLDVDRIDVQPLFAVVRAILNELMGGTMGYSTIVIDTADRLDQLIQDAVCCEANKGGIEDFGYGKGYTYVEEKWTKLLEGFDLLQKKTGVSVVFVCHSTQRKVEEPGETGSYDHYELKLSRKASAILKEWADFLLFMKYAVYVEKDKDGKTRATGGQRRIHTAHSTLFDAKTRAELPESLPVDASGLATLFSAIFPAKPAEAAPAAPSQQAAPSQPAAPVKPVLEQLAENAGCNNENAPLREVVESFAGQFEMIRQIDDALAIEGLTREDLFKVTVLFKMRPEGTPLENFSEADLKRILGGWNAVSSNMHKIKGK